MLLGSFDEGLEDGRLVDAAWLWMYRGAMHEICMV